MEDVAMKDTSAKVSQSQKATEQDLYMRMKELESELEIL